MKNFDLCFFKTTWDQSGRNYQDTNLLYTKTNVNGDVQIKIPKKLILDSSNIFYYLSGYISDSSYNGRYHGGIKVYHETKQDNQLIEVRPDCSIYFNSITSIWDSIKIDYIAIHNKNYYSKNLYNQWQQVELEADCSETNTIVYYYYSNGVKGKEYTKDVYVPYSSQGSNSVTCTLDFK